MSAAVRITATRSTVAALLGMALVLVAAYALRSDSGHASSLASTGVQNPDFVTAEIEPGEPCSSGVKSNSGEASQIEGTPVWLPDSKAVPPLEGVWICSGTPTYDY